MVHLIFNYPKVIDSFENILFYSFYCQIHKVVNLTDHRMRKLLKSPRNSIKLYHVYINNSLFKDNKCILNQVQI